MKFKAVVPLSEVEEELRDLIARKLSEKHLYTGEGWYMTSFSLSSQGFEVTYSTKEEMDGPPCLSDDPVSC